MNDLFNPENDGFWNLKGWVGQVVPEQNWLDNIADTGFKHKLHTSGDLAGYSYRYKVRIFGKDSEIKNFSDDHLPMADVILPVTAGSGHAGSIQTPNIKQGMYVWGVFKDGIDATEPLIVGVLPNNSQTGLFPGNTEFNFETYSGFFSQHRPISIATKNIDFSNPAFAPTHEGVNANVVNLEITINTLTEYASFILRKQLIVRDHQVK